MPKLLSGGVLRSGGSGQFIALPGAQPALLPTPSTSTGYTLILNAQQVLSYASSLGDIGFNSGTITALLPNGNLSFAGTGTGTLQFNSDAFFNKQVTFANTFTFTDITASGIIRFTTSTDSAVWNAGAVVINGSLGVGKTLNLNGPLNVYSSTNFYTDVSISPANYNVTISPTGSGKVTISPNTTGALDNMTIGATTPRTGNFLNGNFTRINVSSTLTSTSSNTGSVVIAGGVGIAKDVNIGGELRAVSIFDTDKRVVSQVDINLGKGLDFFGPQSVQGPTVIYGLTNTGVTSIIAGTGTYIDRSTGDVTIWQKGTTLQEVTNNGNTTTNNILFQNTNSATSVSSASIAIAGGVGIAKNLIVGGSIIASSFEGSSVFNTIVVTSSATNSTTFASNALHSIGGVAIDTDLMVGNNAYIYGNLTVFGTLTQTVSTIADIGRKVIALSTSAGPAILSANAGITVGPVANPFIKWLYDGINSWKTTGNILPDQNNAVNLGSSGNQWANIYAVKATISGTATSISTQTGALTVVGGVGVGGNLYASALYDQGNRVISSITTFAGPGIDVSTTRIGSTASITFTNTGVTSIIAGTGTFVSNTTGDVVIWTMGSDLQAVTNAGASTTNAIRILNLTTATTQTGALRVDGGLSVGGNVFIGSTTYIAGYLAMTAGNVNDFVTQTTLTAGTDTAVSTSSGNIVIWNTSTLQSVTNRGNSTTNSISITNTGSTALAVSGGVTIGKNLVVNGTSTFIGPVTFNGTATYVYSTNTYYTDNIIELHTAPGGVGSEWSINDGKDVGLRFHYYKNSYLNGFLGFDNSTGDLKWLSSANEISGVVTGVYGKFRTGSIQLFDTSASISTQSGALIVSGGAGIGGDVFVGGLINGTATQANSVAVSTTSTDALYYVNFVSSTTGYLPELTTSTFKFNPVSGILTAPRSFISSATISVSTDTGALVVQGGAGFGGDLYARTIYSNGSQVLTLQSLNNYGVTRIIAGTDTAVSSQTGVVTIWSTATLDSLTGRTPTTTNALFVGTLTSPQIVSPLVLTSAITSTNTLTVASGDGTVQFINQGNSSSTTTGAVTVLGGVGVGGNVYATALYDQGNRVVTRVTPIASNAIGIDFIAVNGTATTFTIQNLGVRSLTATPGIGISASTGSIILTNLGVTATIGTSYIGVSASTGSVTFTNLGVNTLAGTTYIGVSTSTGSVSITNLGVQTLTAGTDTVVSSSTGTVTVWNNSTLDSVVKRGATTTYAINVGTATSTRIITNEINPTGNLTVTPAGGSVIVSSNSTATISGQAALQISNGGIFVGSNIIVAGQTSQIDGTSTNALYVKGGVAIEKDLTVRGRTLFSDTVTFNGTATFVYSTNTYYTDNLLELHTPPSGPAGNWTLDDGKDIGLRFHYYTGGTDTNAALVLANDTKYLEWYSSGAENTSSQFAGTATYGIFKAGGVQLVNTTESNSTNTGALTVIGGAGIGKNLYVGGSATITGTIYGNVVGTVTNLKGGAVGSIPIQSSADTTSFIPLGAEGYVLIAGINTATWQPLGSLTINDATNALNIAVTTTNVNQVFYPTFVDGTSGFRKITVESSWGYNPVTRILKLGGATDSTSTNTGALQVVGGIGIGGGQTVGGSQTINVDQTIKGNQQVNGVITIGSGTQFANIISATLGSGTAGLPQIVDLWSTSAFRTAKYLVQITDTGYSPVRVHVSELSIIHDGANNIYTTEYGINTSVGQLGTFDATISVTTLQLKFRPNGTGLTPSSLVVKLSRTLVTI